MSDPGRLCALFYGLATLACLALPGNSAQAQPSEPAGASAELAPGLSGVVVLIDGQVLAGRLSETGGGYRVDFNGSFATVPFERVAVMAATLQDAYRLLSERMKTPLAGDHLQLAEWCIQQRMLEEAKIEVSQALKLEPLRSDARALLWAIEQQLTAAKMQPAAGLQVSGTSPRRDQQVNASGLSRETQQQFIRLIQPLVMNKCGSAGCHGGENDQRFRLAGNRSSSQHQRASSASNLQAVLEQINPDRPFDSPLITKPGELSASHRQLFQGPAGVEQRQKLIEWVQRVAAETPREQAGGNVISSSPPQVVEGPRALPQGLQEDASPLAEKADPVLAGPKAEPASLDPETLRAILRQHAPDAFNPEEFNELVHGRRSAASP